MTQQQIDQLIADFGGFLTQEDIDEIDDLDLEVIYGWSETDFVAVSAELVTEQAAGFMQWIQNPVNQGIVEGVIAICETVAEFADQSVNEYAGGIGGGPGQGGGSGGNGGGNN